MALPTFHSCTWSDDDAGTSSGPTDQELHPQGPESLQDKELYVWVTYPDRKRPKFQFRTNWTLPGEGRQVG